MSETHYSLKEMETQSMYTLSPSGSISVRNPLLSERDGNTPSIDGRLLVIALSETHYSLKEMETPLQIPSMLSFSSLVRNPLLSERDGNLNTGSY